MAGAQYLGPLTTTVNYGSGIRMEPPKGSPDIPWTRALDSCSPSCAVDQIQPVVELVSYSDDQYAVIVASSSRPIYQKVLAYAVIWDGVRCHTIGGPWPFTLPDPNQRCVNVLMVDAKTGEGLMSFSQTQT